MVPQGHRVRPLLRLVPFHPRLDAGERGRGGEAADEYRKAADWQQSIASYQYAAGYSTFIYQGKVKLAISYLEAAVHVQPDHFEAHRDLGWALFQAGDTDAAIRQYKEALRINPKSPEAHDYLGRALLVRNDVDGAAAELQEALAVNPNDANAHYFLAEAFMRQGKIMEAARERVEAQRLSQPPGEQH